MSELIDKLARELVDDVIDRALSEDSDDSDSDWSPYVQEEAYRMLADRSESASDPTAAECGIIDAYAGPDGFEAGGGTVTTIDIVAERYEHPEDLREAIQSAAATCVAHRALDMLGDLGIQG